MSLSTVGEVLVAVGVEVEMCIDAERADEGRRRGCVCHAP